MKKCENPECENIVTEYQKNKPKELNRYCSTTCRGRHNSRKSREKAKQTCINRHGVEHPMHLVAIKEKAKSTMLVNHGGKHPMCSNEIREKLKQTNLERHGVENVMQSKLFRDKAKQTMLERHGVENPFQSPEIKEKIKQTHLTNLGVENPFQSPEIKEKIKQTHLTNLGVENPAQCDKIKEKMKETNFKKYMVEYVSQILEIKERKKKTNMLRRSVEYPMQSTDVLKKAKQTYSKKYNSNAWTNKHIDPRVFDFLNSADWLKTKNNTCTITEIATELNVSNYAVWRRFKQFNIPVKRQFKSFFEKQVFEFVKSIYPNIIQNDRKQIKPFELDIWFPDLNMAIECNGRYFHQDQEREQNKIDRCKEKGIYLHFIWDDDWKKDQEKMKNFIKDQITIRLTKYN